jgi:enamine deaminase RidA (YjgF/YER057c/UK114 family)
MTIDVVVPQSMRQAYDRFHYAPAVREGGLIFCSGVIGQGETAEAEFRNAWEIVGVVLAEAGAGFADIVDTTIYIVDLATHAGPMAAAKDAVIHEPYPASTWIGVSALARPGTRAEIKVVARARS